MKFCARLARILQNCDAGRRTPEGVKGSATAAANSFSGRARILFLAPAVTPPRLRPSRAAAAIKSPPPNHRRSPTEEWRKALIAPVRSDHALGRLPQLKTQVFAHHDGCARQIAFLAREADRQSLKSAKQVAPDPDMRARRQPGAAPRTASTSPMIGASRHAAPSISLRPFRKAAINASAACSKKAPGVRRSRSRRQARSSSARKRLSSRPARPD